MAQALKKSVPSLTAAHLAGFTTVGPAVELHVGGAPEFRAAVFYPQWWRNPAIVMRGWRPRAIPRRLSLSDRIANAAIAAFVQVREWHERARSRQALLRLDEHMLRDLGIDRGTAQFKGSLPFWREDD
jgi:uncharacterized protein YjiS (DUF1127 family)